MNLGFHVQVVKSSQLPRRSAGAAAAVSSATGFAKEFVDPLLGCVPSLTDFLYQHAWKIRVSMWQLQHATVIFPGKCPGCEWCISAGGCLQDHRLRTLCGNQLPVVGQVPKGNQPIGKKHGDSTVTQKSMTCSLV